jgi:N-dimethylarginine dimethylaminohydrolase
MSKNKHLYLCSPDYLNLYYAINPWMDVQKTFVRETAFKQWQTLVKLYNELMPGKVTLVEPQEGLTELCFFGDSVFMLKDKALFSRMATAERLPENEYVINYFKNKIHYERVEEGSTYEGSGETMLWRDTILVGYGQRSSFSIINKLNSYFNTPVIGFELTSKHYYHLDTALFPASENLIAAYLPAFSEKSQAAIRALDSELIELSHQDSLDFAPNSIALGNDLIVHYQAKNIIQKFRDRGFTVHDIDVSEFIKFGGGLKCLTLQHYL